MLGFAVPAGSHAADPLADVKAADAFWRMLPRSDPVGAQKAVCGALADLIARSRPDTARLRALLAIDQHARNLVDGLLVNYPTAEPRPSSLEKPYWQAAFELCRSLGQAHSHFLTSMRDALLSRAGRDYLRFVILRLFQHRQIELLLRPFVDELSTRLSWRELHEAYQLAHSRGLTQLPLPVNRCHSRAVVESTLETEYIHVLLQDLMNDGQFPPHDAFWASQRIPGWSKALALEPRDANGAEHRFVIDLDSDAGLVRLSLEPARASPYLDTAPILEAIRSEIASVRDAREPATGDSRLGRPRRLKLLRKLGIIYAPKPPVIARRGERKPVAMQVDTVTGMTHILRALRNKAQSAAVAAPAAVPEIEEITITAFGGFTVVPSSGTSDGGRMDAQRLPGAVDATHQLLKLVDHSDSGCRLQGQMFRSNRAIPGALIAFRVDAAAPWTLAVVRRVEKIAGNRVNIGTEYVGKDPRGVIVTLAEDSPSRRAGPADAEDARFPALYLPESTKHPVLPIKTLILPAGRFAPDDRLTVSSATSVYTIQLKEPLEEQSEFIWSPFEIVDRKPAAEPATRGATAATT